MTDAPYPTRKRGIAGIVFVLCALIGGLGFVLEWTRPMQPFWIGAAPGGRAAIAAIAVVLTLLSAQLLRLLLARRIDRGGRDAGD